VMCPPFIITHAEIDELVAILARSLDQARQPLRALG
jgi:putrescine aminotransferase